MMGAALLIDKFVKVTNYCVDVCGFLRHLGQLHIGEVLF